MFGKLKKFILLGTALLAISGSAPAQKRNEIKPPAEAASLAETQQWVVGTVAKYGSYKTRMEAVTLSHIKFDGCTFGFTQTRKSGSTSTATMGPTRTTYSSKEDFLVDLTKVRTEGISLEDHLYPEVQNIRFWYAGFDLSGGSTAGSVFYIVVKQEAAGALRAAFVQIQQLCKVPR